MERVGVVAVVSLGASPGRVPSDHHLHLCTQGTWLQPRVGGRWPTLWRGPAVPSLSLRSSFVNGAGHIRSVTSVHINHSAHRKRTAAARETVPTTLSFPCGHGISQESWWFPGQTAHPLHPRLKCRRSGSGGHSHGPFIPTQAGLLPNALTPGSCQPDWGGGAPLLCLPHPSFPDTSCPLQVLGACSADTDWIWASLSIYFLLTSALKA